MRHASVFLLTLGISVPVSAAPAVFDPAQAGPFFSSGPAAEARRSFEMQAWKDAADRFGAYLRVNPRAPDRLQASFLGGVAQLRAGRFVDAANTFDRLVKPYALLADHHRLYAARAFVALKRWTLALERARAVPAGSPLSAEAVLLRADALRQLHMGAEAEREYRRYLEKFPGSWREPEARFHLAEVLPSERWSEARALYLRLHVGWPTASWGRLARERLEKRDAKALVLSGRDHLERGLALFEEMRNLDAEAELKAALAVGDLDGKQRCQAAYHLAQSVFKARQRARAASLFDGAADLCAAVAGDAAAGDLHMKALYQGARCHAAKGEAEVAAKLFARAETEHPAHTYADDARLRQAEIWAGLAVKEANDAGVSQAEARAAELLAGLIDRYPVGDMRSEALFRLFFRAWKSGDVAQSRRWLETALAKVPREEGWWEAGRTLYWLGRVAEREGKAAAAVEAFTRCLREYPLSYYALMAFHRLKLNWRKSAEALLRELGDQGRDAPTWKFAPRELFASAGFRRGVELARLGLGSEARRELAAIGIRPPVNAKSRTAKPVEGEEELLWLAAVLYDRAGVYSLSHAIPRHVLTDYAREWPRGQGGLRWRLSYPRGYLDLVVENTKKNGLPDALEFAIMREESAFDPTLESFANAVGLTQLTRAAAQRFAQGLPYDGEALRDPVINLAIGARELGHLWNRYRGNAALAIAGYNAGEGAVGRWLAAAPAGQGLDEFVESIPYDETRGYTKRVLASYFAYRWLYQPSDPVPPLPLDLPAKK